MLVRYTGYDNSPLRFFFSSSLSYFVIFITIFSPVTFLYYQKNTGICML